ncbi:hypothetical protein ACFPRL_04685 [Pseudoclavibacter helvolus]
MPCLAPAHKRHLELPHDQPGEQHEVGEEEASNQQSWRARRTPRALSRLGAGERPRGREFQGLVCSAVAHGYSLSRGVLRGRMRVSIRGRYASARASPQATSRALQS